ncbi:hypothetical protein C8J56DRAFT_1048835 [Mycena floridula]|nr:hypothetical protein C8J56DRAFT_1048835 [Mycena floridula]
MSRHLVFYLIPYFIHAAGNRTLVSAHSYEYNDPNFTTISVTNDQDEPLKQDISILPSPIQHTMNPSASGISKAGHDAYSACLLLRDHAARLN